MQLKAKNTQKRCKLLHFKVYVSKKSIKIIIIFLDFGTFLRVGTEVFLRNKNL